MRLNIEIVLDKCIGLYITQSICSVITGKGSRKCKCYDKTQRSLSLDAVILRLLLLKCYVQCVYKQPPPPPLLSQDTHSPIGLTTSDKHPLFSIAKQTK